MTEEQIKLYQALGRLYTKELIEASMALKAFAEGVVNELEENGIDVEELVDDD